MGCGGSDVVRNTKTVWGDKTGNLGNFIPFFQGRVADVKTLKVDALLDELRDVAGFEVRIRYSFDGLFWDGDETLRAEDTPVGGWYYGTAFHQVLRNWQYWQVGFLIEDEGGASVGTARVELRLTKSSTMDLVLGTRADNQIARWDGESGLQGSSITIDDSGNLVLNSGDQIQFGGTTTNIDGLNSGDLVASAGGHIVLNAGTNHDVAIAENDSWWTRFSSAQYTFGLATNGSP